jgi:crotonobetainyl-CoA:carnitine CoA-transferase CaiB-like acyl-CoA transferase
VGAPENERESTASGHELGAVRVVDCSAGIAGAYCAKMFADAGADVVLVEPPAGAPLRTWTCNGAPPAGADGALFRYLRHGQRSIIAASATELASIFADADVVLIDADPVTGGFDGPSPQHLHADRPDLVVVAISPHGLVGPYANRPASELTVQADSGALAIRGRADRPPVQAGGQVTEWVTGAFAAAAAVCAVRGRASSGRGALLDVSWAEVANMTCTLFSDTFDAVAGRPDLTGAPPSRSFETPSVEPTLDGFVGFNTNTRQQFEDFLVLIDRPDLLADPSWANVAARTARWDEWNETVHAWTMTRTTAEIVEQAALLRIPVSPVTDAPLLLQLEHPRRRGVFIDDPRGEFRMPRRPWTLDGETAPAPMPAPALGQHTGRVRREPTAAVPAGPVSEAALALTGLRVVDLTGWWAGPSATALFAALGADVVHVESIRRPDGIRMAGGAFIARPQWWELSPFFLAANTNKRDLTLDLGSEAGRRLLLDLVRDADVVIENFTPRVLESFDLGWDVIHATNPRAVMVRMPAFGLDGPWRDRPGFAQTMEQMTGLAWLTGHVDDQPRIQRGPCDPNGGMHAAFATMVALTRRDRTGLGCLVEAPMFEAAVAVAAEPVLEFSAYGNVLARNGNRSVRAAPQGVYACAGREQWLALSVLDDVQWTAFARAVGAADWLDDAQLTTAAGRHARHDELDVHISAWAAARPLAEAVTILVDAGVPAAGAIEPRRSHTNPQFIARGYFEVVDHPVAGPIETPTQPFRWSGIERWVRTPAPLLGQHNVQVLTALGCSPADIDQLAADGVIGTAPIF